MEETCIEKIFDLSFHGVFYIIINWIQIKLDYLFRLSTDEDYMNIEIELK